MSDSKDKLEELAISYAIEPYHRRLFRQGYADGLKGGTVRMTKILRELEKGLARVESSKAQRVTTSISCTKAIDYVIGWAAGHHSGNGIYPPEFAAGVYESFFGHPDNDLSNSYRKGYKFGSELQF